MIISYGDLLFRSYILRDLTENHAALTVVVDSNAADLGARTDFAWCSEPDDRAMWGQAVTLKRLGREAASGTAPNGRWIGLVRARGEGRRWLEDGLRQLQQRDDFARLGLPDLLNLLVDQGHAVHVWYVHGHWLDVNSLQDLASAGHFTAGS
jgi:phosphoenolpyruvate phosphomutase